MAHDPARNRTTGPLVALSLLAGIAVIVLGYAVGWLSTLGYEYRQARLNGYLSGGSSGGSVGFTYMYFVEGQTFFAQYDAEVRRGALRIGIFKTFADPDGRPHFTEYVRTSGRGEVTYRIPQTGLYTMYFDGSVLGKKPDRGIDVDYSVRWGMR